MDIKEIDKTIKKQIKNRRLTSGVGVLVITFAVFIVLVLISGIIEIPNNTAEETTEEITETNIEIYKEVKLPVVVGNYSYYVPEDAEIEYEDLMVTVNCSGYGIKSYFATGAPQTADAVLELYGPVLMAPFTNENDVNGVIIEGVYEEATTVKTFCFTIDEVFHAIEVWAESEHADHIAEEVFDTICYTDHEKLRKELLEKEQMEAYEERVKAAYEAAMRAATEDSYSSDYSDSVARGYYRR